MYVFAFYATWPCFCTHKKRGWDWCQTYVSLCCEVFLRICLCRYSLYWWVVKVSSINYPFICHPWRWQKSLEVYSLCTLRNYKENSGRTKYTDSWRATVWSYKLQKRIIFSAFCNSRQFLLNCFFVHFTNE